MKFHSVLALFFVSIVTGFSQEALVNPSSVTLTKQGTVTLIVTDNKGSSSGGSYVTVGTLTATYTNAVSGYAANQGFNYITASSATTGILDAGTYSVTTYNSPQQVTVILWGESAGSDGITLDEIELAYSSASTTDQASFQTFIVSLVQQQLSALQGQITTQQNQIVALQDSDSDNASAISFLQEQLGSMQASFDALLGEFDTLNTRVSQLEVQLASIGVSSGASSSAGINNENGDDTLAYLGMGLGAAGVIGAIANAILNSQGDVPSENQ